MADLDYIHSTLETKLVGQDASGNNLNQVGADANGNMLVKDYSDGPVTPGTVASASSLAGGQFNTSLPTLTNTQQSAIQLDSSGRVIVRDPSLPATSDTNFGTVGASTLRVAAEPGNASGLADFNAGTTGAQTLRTSSNITRNGTELSYNAGASDANTIRTASNLKIEGTSPDTNYGTVGANTLRTASQIGNAAGAASFGAGTTGAQTLRVASNLYDGSANAISSSSNGNASPQQLLNVQVPDTTVASTALGALNAAISVSLAGLTGAGFQIASGTLIGTLTPQLSFDGGATYPVNTLFYNPATQSTQATLVFASANTSNTLSIVVSGGASHSRVIVTAYTSGTANATMRATEVTSTQITTAASAISTGNIFSVAILALNAATAGSENPMIYIKNASANTKSIYFESSYAGTLIANRGFSFEVYANPTISANGTTQTPVNRTLGNATTSVMNVFTAPTVTSNGSLFSTIILAQNASSISIIDSFALKIPPGNSILITANPSSNNTTAYFSITWSEY